MTKKEEEIQNHKKWTRQLIEVMQAYLDGKEIQHQENIGERYAVGPWTDDAFPTWNWYENDYRIKGE